MEWTCGCGAVNAGTVRFCTQCGAPNPGPEAAPTPAPPAEPAAPPPAPPAGPAPVVTPSAKAAVPVPPSAPPPPTFETRPGVAAEAAAEPPKKKSNKALILVVGSIVLLVAFCILSIVAAIAIPNLLSAIQRAKQKRAMGELRSIATACQSYATDNGHFPMTGHSGDSYYSIVDTPALSSLLVPDYIAAVPEKDPWGHPYSYGVSADGREFVVLCSGADGKLTLSSMPTRPVQTQCFEDDIVWENDAFIQAPGGRQRKCGGSPGG